MRNSNDIQAVVIIICLLLFMPFNICMAKDTTPKTQSLNYLTKYKNTYDHEKVLKEPIVNANIRPLVGDQYKHLQTNLATLFPIELKDNCLILQGIAAHRGGEEEAFILIDLNNKKFDVGLLSNKKIMLFSKTTDYNSLPKLMRDWIADTNKNCLWKKDVSADVEPDNLIWNKKTSNKTKK